MTTFKGTNKDMKCYGNFQYELEMIYMNDGAICCETKGFHSCEVPMDVWTYFPPTGGNRFFCCEIGGKIDRSDKDSRIASSELMLKTEIDILGIMTAQIEHIKKIAKGNIAQGDRGHAAAQGDSGHAAAQGYSGHAAAQGDWGHAAAQGDWGHAAAQGNWGYAEVHGEHSIAASFGIDGAAMAKKIGSWITVYEWDEVDGEWCIKDGKCARVDGEKIKPNVWYKLENGEFVAVQKLCTQPIEDKEG